MPDSLFSGALGAAPALLIAIVLEIRDVDFHKDAPSWGRGLLRTLVWAGFAGCVVAAVVSTHALAATSPGGWASAVVKYCLYLGFIAFLLVGGLKVAWSPLGGMSAIIARDQEALARRANAKRRKRAPDAGESEQL